MGLALALFLLVSNNFQPASFQNSTSTMRVDESHDIAVPDLLKKQLTGAADVRTSFKFADDDISIVYDTVRDAGDSADYMDNHPHVAVFHKGKLALDVDASALASAGPVSADNLTSFRALSGYPILAVSFRLGVNGAGTFFVLIGAEHAGYKVLSTLQGSQAQLRFYKGSPNRLELWTADGFSSSDPEKQCVWCPKLYRQKVYAWRDGKLALIASTRSNRVYDPESFDNRRFVIQ